MTNPPQCLSVWRDREHALAKQPKRHCVTTTNLVKNVSDAFDVFNREPSRRRLTIPDDIPDPLKSIATKAGAHVATVVASVDKAISTGAAELMDGLNGWRDAVPVYFCLQTRGVWQLGYPNDTTEFVPYGELNMSQTFRITVLEDLWQAARLVVPGLPEDVLLEMDSADLNALSRVGIAPYWLLSFVLVGTYGESRTGDIAALHARGVPPQGHHTTLDGTGREEGSTGNRMQSETSLACCIFLRRNLPPILSPQLVPLGRDQPQYTSGKPKNAACTLACRARNTQHRRKRLFATYLAAANRATSHKENSYGKMPSPTDKVFIVYAIGTVEEEERNVEIREL
ncbi:hypothetical protein CGGC5_v017045 [Colletotrichum fructicola Nara gc5]|uniref:Uncharacterized protein n=1 Tax=Colletotrichum fructicola (strain Nara gc5) TaxID=1213859 RepID=A0A7J6IE64_COLFN|nr:hypothetical protein CGGC5_v017045 [Colletotrichum fructicola Nara gc5]